MNFTIEEFPSAKLEAYGVSKKEQNAAFGYTEMQKLLDGQKTDIIRLSLQREGVRLDVDARFSLQRNPDNTVSLMMHKVGEEYNKELNFVKSDIERLKKGEIIKSSHQNEPILSQLDEKTQRILQIQQSKLIVPDVINDIHLGLDQKAALREGKAIELQKGDNKFNVKLDLNQKSGFRMEQSDLKIEKKQNNQISY